MKGIQNKQFNKPLYATRPTAKTRDFQIGDMVWYQSQLYTIESYEDGLFELVDESGDVYFDSGNCLTLYSDYQPDEYFDRTVKRIAA